VAHREVVSDVQARPARPIYHHKRESIQAHLSIVFAALAVTKFVEDRSGWSIKKFVRTARRYRTVQIRAGRTGAGRRCSPLAVTHGDQDEGLGPTGNIPLADDA
jgi:hypothetical protein